MFRNFVKPFGAEIESNDIVMVGECFDEVGADITNTNDGHDGLRFRSVECLYFFHLNWVLCSPER